MIETEAPPAERARALLRAGALLPTSWAAPADEPLATISARSYAHSALGDRVVVRLVAETLDAAEDATLEAFGFHAIESAPAVARGRRRPRGFVGFVAITRPHLLSALSGAFNDFDQLSRLAANRPGAAREGFEALAERLVRTDPAVLPAFYEEGARAFIDAGNAAQAAALFGKARTAERLFALEVDPEQRDASFLEFAVAGALNGRALEDYADQLSGSEAPLSALNKFRRLCVERTRAGMPPWAGMGTRLAGLAAGAGLDPAAAAEDVLHDVLPCAALAQAGGGFWRTYRRTLIDMAQASPPIRCRLLNLMPVPTREAGDFADWWLDLLDACGATRALTDIEPDPEDIDVRPEGGPAGWLVRFLSTTVRHGWNAPPTSARVMDLLERMGERLRADGEPLELFGSAALGTRLELVDRAIALGLPVRLAGVQTLSLHRWLAQTNRAPLAHIRAHPILGPSLEKAVDDYLRTSHADTLVDSVELLPLVESWLERTARLLATGCLADVADVLGKLSRSTTLATFRASPRAVELLRGADVAAALHRTLVGGLIDEFGWPALDEARAKLGGKTIHIGQAWPNLVIADDSQAIVVGPDGILLEHDLRRPTAQGYVSSPGFVYADGQLLCCWARMGVLHAYWSGRPGETFDPGHMPPGLGFAHASMFTTSYELPGGGRTLGGRVVHAGDTRLPASHHMLTDGTRFWRLDEHQTAFEEYDPHTGRGVGHRPPPFIEVRDDGWELVPKATWLLPLPEHLAESTPLGSADGLAGWRVLRNRETGQLRGDSLDGRRLEWSPPMHYSSLLPYGLVGWPGDDAFRILAATNSVLLFEPGGVNRLLEALIAARRTHLSNGTLLLPPPPLWHCLRQRDAAGSRALRSVAPDTARTLLRVAAEEASPENKYPRTLEAIKQLLPEITAPGLRAGVLGAAAYAAGLARRLSSLEVLQATAATTQLVSADPPVAVAEPDLRSALSGFLDPVVTGIANNPRQSGSTVEQLWLVGQYFAAVLAGKKPPLPKTLPARSTAWELFVGAIGAVCYLAASPFVSEAEREALIGLLEVWKQSPFCLNPQRFRLYGMYEAGWKPPQGAWLEADGDHTYLFGHGVLLEARQYRYVLEFSPGEFKRPANLTPVWERIPLDWPSADQIQELIERIRTDGPFAWDPELAHRLAHATGMTRAEAALLLAGLPRIHARQHHFLSAELRERLQLKMSEANAARAALKSLPPQRAIDLLAACLPRRIAELWESPEASVDRLGEAWSVAYGRHVELPEAVVLAAHAELGGLTEITPQTALAAVANPDVEPRLNVDAHCELDVRGRLQSSAAAAPQFDLSTLRAVSRLIAWSFVNLPVGDPIRAGIPRAIELLRQRLRNPDLVFEAKWVQRTIRGADLLQTLPGGLYTGSGGTTLPTSKDLGWAVVVAPQASTQIVHTFVRPARVTGSEHPDLIGVLGLEEIMSLVQFVLGPRATALADRVSTTPVPYGQFETNPLLSAPELVDEVAARCAIGSAAAALYLQLLALSEPTMKHCLRSTGWMPAEYRQAADELLGRELVVGGNRPRAGRRIFLPGPWVNARAPNLPMEQWKLSLYDGGSGLAGRYLPTRPVHELFGQAWARIVGGDRP